MTSRRLPSLNAIRTFDSAARHLNFTQAASELCVTPGAVSRMIQSLEEELGVSLFYRHGRTLTLTQTGTLYFHEIAEALNRIALATRALKTSTGNNLLKVSVLPTFALRWLVPKLHEFQALYPDILVDVTSSEHLVDFRTEPIDVGIRYGLGQWPHTESTFLMHEDMGIFCAPAYLERSPALTCPTDLTQHRLLQHTTRPNSWQEYLEAFNISVTQLPCITGGFEHFFMVIEAAAAGMGVALLPLFLAQTECTAGRLIQPLPQTLRRKQAYYVVHAPNTRKLLKIKVFKEWLLKEALL